MKNYKDIPELISEADLAEALGVTAKTIPAMVEQGTLPAPDGQRRDKGYWKLETAEAFFSQINECQSAYAPISTEFGMRQLKAGIYACPARSNRHIGMRRPSKLALLNGGQAYVYSVTAIFTEDGAFGEELITDGKVDATQLPSAEEVHEMRESLGAEEGPLTIFYLDTTSRVACESVGRQQGGTIKTDSLNAAIASGRRWARISNGEIEVEE